ncbi:hypothetical protein [Brucella intermedia]|uniref:hypothetical protein n=1 Tax=Brucella intermedia TaxID=94625 RepID=UPI00089CAF4A|nr:hypothetical protein [Brucella intermedia]SEB68257.1 hypothetical protein SAMN05519105_1080 [Rhodobacter sp. 24-YEA-8]
MLQAVESELTMVLGEGAAALMLENRLRCMVRADTANAGERSEHPGSLSAREISLNKRLLLESVSAMLAVRTWGAFLPKFDGQLNDSFSSLGGQKRTSSKPPHRCHSLVPKFRGL